MAATILLIDDKIEYLKPLKDALQARLPALNIESWIPTPEDGPKPFKKFETYLNNDLRLVVTDYDLTEQGQLGFFGATVVDWCQVRGIPVGDFSRGDASSLAKEPNLFEIRVPIESTDASTSYIATVYEGFDQIRQAIAGDPTLLSRKSPASALAAILGAKNLENQFAQYGVRYGGANSSLVDRFAATAAPEVHPANATKQSMLEYIIGHLLLNAVLKFPGPILDSYALAAFLATAAGEYDKYEALFTDAKYTGPFADLKPFYWTSKCQDILGAFADQLAKDASFETVGEQNRAMLELAIGAAVEKTPECERCHGKNGGFWCPFTKRAVCELPDCSVVSNVWIPAGARLSRIERGFYDEWAPILGM